ncbi:hypothetical protein Hamer_G026695, partial [Homarus americanus]
VLNIVKRKGRAFHMVVCEAARQTKPLLHTLGNHFWTSELTCCRSMASQKTIKNFFKHVNKRKSEDLEERPQSVMMRRSNLALPQSRNNA